MLNTKLSKNNLQIELDLQEGGFYNEDGSLNEAAVTNVLCRLVDDALSAKAHIERQAINKARSQQKQVRQAKPNRNWLHKIFNHLEEEEI